MNMNALLPVEGFEDGTDPRRIDALVHYPDACGCYNDHGC
jgi:hypothetical protein